MTDQQAHAKAFHALHVPGDPLVLFNVWDPGSARAVAEAGAKALATGSASVAGSRGYADGENMPLDEIVANAKAIVESVELPVSLDFEGGYAVEPGAVAANVAQVIETGIVGINFEDRIVGGEGLHPMNLQAERIAAIRAAADTSQVDFFINARTDVWLPAGEGIPEAVRCEEALARAQVYAEAGANGFFAPGLGDENEIARVCEACPLPVNAMMFGEMPSHARLAELGVARISHAGGPWRLAMTTLTEAARPLFGD